MSHPPIFSPDSTFPSNHYDVLAQALACGDWLTYRIVRSLQFNYNSGQLRHLVIYRPVVSPANNHITNPLRPSVEHHFIWSFANVDIPCITTIFIINPAFPFYSPRWSITKQHHRPYPIIHSLWYDSPTELPEDIVAHLQELHLLLPHEGIEFYLNYIKDFIDDFLAPVTPIHLQQLVYPRNPPLSSEDNEE